MCGRIFKTSERLCRQQPTCEQQPIRSMFVLRTSEHRTARNPPGLLSVKLTEMEQGRSLSANRICLQHQPSVSMGSYA